ncbi:MAG: glycosyltransferase [Solirubrobacterales bacterium]
MARVLVVSAEPIGDLMAGPAIRALELARVLSAGNDVSLSAPGLAGAGLEDGITAVDAGFEDYDALSTAIEEVELVVAQALPPRLLSRLPELGTRLIADLYNPTVFEVLEAGRDKRPPSRRRQQRAVARAAGAMLAAASRVMCASEAQRDLWLGMMAALDRVPLQAYDRDPSLRSFIDVVPFGVPAEPPVSPGTDPVRDMFPSIGDDGIVLLWGGGVWNWLDAPTAIDAVLEVNRRREGRPPVHLVFMGVGRPGEVGLDAMQATGAMLEHLRTTGQEGELIHVNRGWVPYRERGDWLATADAALSAHHDHLETRFAFRTRMLDAVWAGLPVIATRGDELSAAVERSGMGTVAPAGDVQALAAAIEGLVYDPAALASARRNAQALAADLAWERCAAPLVEWCRHPAGGLEPDRRLLRRMTFGRYPGIIAETADTDGIGGALAQVGRNLRRLVARR